MANANGRQAYPTHDSVYITLDNRCCVDERGLNDMADSAGSYDHVDETPQCPSDFFFPIWSLQSQFVLLRLLDVNSDGPDSTDWHRCGCILGLVCSS